LLVPNSSKTWATSVFGLIRLSKELMKEDLPDLAGPIERTLMAEGK
jgi:hypothetical protein